MSTSAGAESASFLKETSEGWRKSTYCTGSDTTCVLFQQQTDLVLIRRSGPPGNGPPMAFTKEEWRAFVSGVKAGEFDV